MLAAVRDHSLILRNRQARYVPDGPGDCGAPMLASTYGLNSIIAFREATEDTLLHRIMFSRPSTGVGHQET
jgi:hypothetical protein